MNLEIGARSAQCALERPLAPERVRPLARTPFYAVRAAQARIRAGVRLTSTTDVSAPIFIIGCDRSGTTLLGELFAAHPAVSYLCEPYHLWAAIEPATDFLQLYSRGEHHCLLDANSFTATARRRFRRLMSTRPGFTLVEKSPINALRIGYLDAVAPDARFVHIVRDGVEVARSIERMAAVTRRMAFRPPLNEWWGVGDAKWTALERDGRAVGYYQDEVYQLTTDAQRGAYEWLLSLHEVEAWRACLGSRFFELRYQDLIDNPRETLQGLMDSLGLPCLDWWLEQATARVTPANSWQGEPLALPNQMRTDFNNLQASFELKGRAIAETPVTIGQTAPPTNDPRPGSSASRDPRPGSSASRLLQPPAGVRVTRLNSLLQARAFVAEWAELAETAGARNPFTHPEWLMPWAERFLRPDEQVWLLAARQHGRLVGVAPFYRRSWGPRLAHSMQLWGTGRHNGWIELPQLLLDQEQPRTVARALVARLCTEANAWDWAEVPLEDSLWLEPDWLPRHGEVTVLTKMVRASVVLPINQAKQPVMKKNVRESLRRARNRLDRSYPGGWSVTCATDRADLLGALPDLARLHDDRSRLAGKKRHPNSLAQEADWSFLVAGVIASAERGGASIYRLLVHSQAVAALLVLRSRDCTYFLLSGMSQQSWEFSPTTLLQGRAIDDAVALGHRWVNLSTGPDTPKLRWSEQLSVSSEFALIPDRPFSRVAFGAYRQASAAAAMARERDRHRLLPDRTARPT